MATETPRPTGLIASSGIELLTFGTPNGHKASILLEELKAKYGKEYTVQSINISENIQKEPWFTKFSPNGRIPAIVDHDRKDFSVFEGAAILAYLTRHYDVSEDKKYWTGRRGVLGIKLFISRFLRMVGGSVKKLLTHSP